MASIPGSSQPPISSTGTRSSVDGRFPAAVDVDGDRERALLDRAPAGGGDGAG